MKNIVFGAAKSIGESRDLTYSTTGSTANNDKNRKARWLSAYSLDNNLNEVSGHGICSQYIWKAKTNVAANAKTITSNDSAAWITSWSLDTNYQ